MTLLDGKVAVVSGVGRGLGREICLALLREGATVVAGDVDREVLDELEVAAPERLSVTTTDITDAAQCERLADLALREHGQIDVLVNDAYHGGDFLPFLDADLDVWRDIGDVNIWGTLRMTRAVIPAMVERGHGRVIMIVSTALYGIPNVLSYTSAKGGAPGLGKALAAVGADEGALGASSVDSLIASRPRRVGSAGVHVVGDLVAGGVEGGTARFTHESPTRSSSGFRA